MSNIKYIQKLLKNLKNFKMSILFISLCLLISAAISLILPLLNKHMIDHGFMKSDLRVIALLATVMLLLSCFMFALDYIREKIRINIVSKTRFKLHDDAFRHLLKVNINYFDHKNCSEIYNNLNTDINNMLLIINSATFFMISQFFSVIGGLIGLLFISVELTLMVIVFIPIKIILLKYLSRKRYQLTKTMIKNNSMYAHWFEDNLNAFKEIKLFGLQTFKFSEFEVKQKNVIQIDKKINILDVIRQFLDKSIAQIMIFLIYLIGAMLLLDNRLSFGSIFAFINYSVYVISPISAILGIGYIFSGIIPSTKRYYALFNEEVEYHHEGMHQPTACQKIEFRNVCFGFDNKQVLHHINFVIKPAEKVAIVGMNGSGKTTILNLLHRFYQPNSGEILLDGMDIQSIDLHQYRGYFSIVPQETYLFNTTIENNIKLYKHTANQQYRQAINDSQLNDENFDGDHQIPVGRNGTRLSGGQRQKISLARALIRDKPIMIFDEATSQVDLYAEGRINDLIHTRLKDHIVLVVTHRPDILKTMNNIIVIHNGRVADMGHHDALKEKSQLYKQIITHKDGA